MHADFRGNLVGRVPSRGERYVFQQTASDRADVSIVPVLGCLTDFFGGGRWEQEQTEETEKEYSIRYFSTC